MGSAVGASVVGWALGAAVGAKLAKQREPLVGSVMKPSKQAQKTAFEPSLCGTNEQYVDWVSQLCATPESQATKVGIYVGSDVGAAVGASVGAAVGTIVGVGVGYGEGTGVGYAVGLGVG